MAVGRTGGRRARWWLAAALLLLASAGESRAGLLEEATALYRRGDFDQAVAILMPLARHGNARAQFSIAAMYDNGRGLPQNFRLAYHWYKHAAQNGLADAMFFAGKFNSTGRGMKQDKVRAHIFFSLAAAGGYPDASRARNQQYDEMSRGQRTDAQRLAAQWPVVHRPIFRCAPSNCIMPDWLAAPWSPVVPEFEEVGKIR